MRRHGGVGIVIVALALPASAHAVEAVSPPDGAQVGPSPTLTWQLGVGESSLRLAVYTDPSDPASVVFKTALTPTATSIVVPGPLPPGRYWWFVQATFLSVVLTHSDPRTFIVPPPPPPPPPPPVAMTGRATAIGPTTATLHGRTDPRGERTVVRFDYGRTTAYGSQTAGIDVPARRGTTPVSVRLRGLHLGTTYHYRLVASSAAGTATGADRTFRTPTPPPCQNPRLQLLCPDLTMSPPSDIWADTSTIPGRVLLRAQSSLNNVGLGPAQLDGVRAGRLAMHAHQVVQRRHGHPVTFATHARLFFYPVPGQGRYWKFEDAARFELWTLDRSGRLGRRVRVGPKHFYCLRDLVHTFPGPNSPAGPVYPGCNQDGTIGSDTLGTSVGWSDVYPSNYDDQWIDVTGLRGCFAYRMIADPGHHIMETNETNNAGQVIVRLPWGSRARCPRDR
jgi:hypothetical protein